MACIIIKYPLDKLRVNKEHLTAQERSISPPLSNRPVSSQDKTRTDSPFALCILFSKADRRAPAQIRLGLCDLVHVILPSLALFNVSSSLTVQMLFEALLFKDMFRFAQSPLSMLCVCSVCSSIQISSAVCSNDLFICCGCNSELRYFFVFVFWKCIFKAGV